MASDAQIAANRKNALRSTGPRTQKGKQPVARNALRHGLAAIAQLDAGLAAEIERLTDALAGSGPSAEKRRRSYALAEAQFNVFRVRAARVGMIDLSAARQAKERESVEAKLGPEPDAAEREAEAIKSALPQLVRLDRYERRALSRRKKAMRLLDELFCNEPESDAAGP